MRIAILTSGILPVPAVQGGAVENLIDFYLDYNNKYKLHEIPVYRIWHPTVELHSALQSEMNHYYFIKVDGWWAKFKKKLYQKMHREKYYHYSIEYYLEQSLKHIKKQQYDTIIIENRPGYALKLKHITNAKLVYHLHNEMLNSHAYKAKDIYDTASLIITVSDYIKRCVQTINPHDSKTKTVYNGINLSTFSQNDKANRSSLGLHTDDFVIVFSGRLNKEKGILPLVQAIKKLNRIPNPKLLIIGASAYGKDKQPTQFIEQLEKESEPIKDNVVFTGYINYEQVPSYLKTADIAIVPSVWEEPFGLTVVEAMAAGLPLITTRSGAIPEICEGIATIVQRENIVDNLARAILDLYKHPEKRARMSKASLERSKLFDKETYAKNFFTAITDR